MRTRFTDKDKLDEGSAFKAGWDACSRASRDGASEWAKNKAMAKYLAEREFGERVGNGREKGVSP